MELYEFDLIIWNIVILSVLTPNKDRKVKIVSKEYRLFFDFKNFSNDPYESFVHIPIIAW